MYNFLLIYLSSISFHFLTPSHCAGTSHGQCASLVQHHGLHLRTQLQWFGTTAHLVEPGGKCLRNILKGKLILPFDHPH